MNPSNKKLFYYVLISTLLTNIIVTLLFLNYEQYFEEDITARNKRKAIFHLDYIAESDEIPLEQKIKILKAIDEHLTPTYETSDLRSNIIIGFISYMESENSNDIKESE